MGGRDIDAQLHMSVSNSVVPAGLPQPFRFFQIAYVARDLDRATAACGALYGLTRFQVTRDVPIQTRAGEAGLHFALAFSGDAQIEVIQPAGGADEIYRNGLPTDGAAMRLHHLGHLIDHEPTWHAVTQAIAQSGLDVPVSGVFRHEGVALMHYAYVDTRATLGHYLEYMYQTEGGRDLFSQVPRFGKTRP